MKIKLDSVEIFNILEIIPTLKQLGINSFVRKWALFCAAPVGGAKCFLLLDNCQKETKKKEKKEDVTDKDQLQVLIYSSGSSEFLQEDMDHVDGLRPLEVYGEPGVRFRRAGSS